MDQTKTTQALKRIFDQCGTGVLQDRRRFEAYLEDLLPGSACSTERMVLRHALDSSALTLLLRSPALTADAAGRAVEQLQRESRMNAEDAEFVVRCTIAARGGNPDVVISQKVEMERIEFEERREEERIRQEQEEQKRRVEERKRRDEEQRRLQDERRRKEDVQRRLKEEEKRKAEEAKRNQPSVNIRCNGTRTLKLYEDRFVFNSVEVSYRDIKVLWTYENLKWIGNFSVIAACVFLPYLFSDSPWTDPDLGLPLMMIYMMVVPFLMVWVWACNRQMNIAANNRTYVFWLAPEEKKKAVSIIRAKMASQRMK